VFSCFAVIGYTVIACIKIVVNALYVIFQSLKILFNENKEINFCGMAIYAACVAILWGVLCGIYMHPV